VTELDSWVTSASSVWTGKYSVGSHNTLSLYRINEIIRTNNCQINVSQMTNAAKLIDAFTFFCCGLVELWMQYLTTVQHTGHMDIVVGCSAYQTIATTTTIYTYGCRSQIHIIWLNYRGKKMSVFKRKLVISRKRWQIGQIFAIDQQGHYLNKRGGWESTDPSKICDFNFFPEWVLHKRMTTNFWSLN